MINTISIIMTRVLGAFCLFTALSYAVSYFTGWDQFNKTGFDFGTLVFFGIIVVVLIAVGVML